MLPMTKYVIGPDVAIRLAHDQAVIRDEQQILAPALLRSQVLSLLYQAVHRGEMTKAEADRQLSYLRGLRIRLLGTVSSRTSPGRSPASSAGPTPLTQSTSP